MQLSQPFKIRCSAIGQIMTNPKTKSEALSKTCIGYIHSWIKEQPEFYGRHVNFKSKYTSKGNQCENDSIAFAAKYYGWPNETVKNDVYFENDFLTGTPDLILPESVEDIKNSWSQATFPLFANEIPIDGYGWQGQGYMELTDRDKFGLIYTLMDAPDNIVEREAWIKCRELGLEELEYDLHEEVRELMTYSNLRDEIRIKRFGLDRDRSAIELVSDRVDLCRKYIQSL